jgi:hypothetical protein
VRLSVTSLGIAFAALLGTEALAEPPQGRYTLSRARPTQNALEKDGEVPSRGFKFEDGTLEAHYDGAWITIDGSDWPVIAKHSDHIPAEHPEPTSRTRYYLKLFVSRGRHRAACAGWKVDENGKMLCGDGAVLKVKYLGA